ncbi:hypothetical protein ACX9I7_00985 [Streptomyces sp. L500]
MPEDIGSRLARLEKQVNSAIRAPKLASASLEDATLHVHDDQGSLRALIGQQPDGTSGVTVVNGPTPPTPIAPTVAPAMASLVVTWDGKFENGAVSPLDFARVEVHVSPTESFEPDASTLRGTIETAQGGHVTVPLGYQQWWVRLRTRSLSGAASPATAAVAGEPRQTGTADIAAGSITADKLSVGSTGNLVPDPGFETGGVEARITTLGLPWARIETGGHDSGRCLTIDTTAAEPRWFPYEPFPVLGGDLYWLGVHYRCSTNWSGASVSISLVWKDATGKILDSGTIAAPQPQGDDGWRRITGKVRAPEGAVRAEARLEAAGTAGQVSFDNAEVRSIMTSATTGERAEIAPDGVRLYDGQGEQVVSLVTGAPNYLSLTSHDGTAVASISDTGSAGFQSLAVADRLTWRGTDLQTTLDRLPRGVIAIGRQTSRLKTTGTEVGWFEIGFDADPAREYRIVVDAHVEPSVGGGELRLRLRDGGADTPTLKSPQIQSAVHQLVRTGAWQRVRLELPVSGAALGAGRHRLLATFDVKEGPSGQSVTLIGGDGYPAVMYVEDVGPKLTESGGFNTGGSSSGGSTPDPKPVPQQYTKTYTAAWTGSYDRRADYSTFYGDKLLQGYYSETHGTLAALAGFPAEVAKDLAGATVLRAEVYLYFDHWYSSSGGTAVIKTHGHGSRPASFSSYSASKSVDFGRNEGKWIDISNLFDPARTKGIALDPNSTADTYYGRAHGVGQANPPQLRITYTR